VLGFQTHRDQLAMSWTREEQKAKLSELRNNARTDGELREKYALGNPSHWSLHEAREVLRTAKNWESKIIPVTYRPFDNRVCFFDETLADRPRHELKTHMALRRNLALNFVRQTKAPHWRHALVSDQPTPAVFLEIKDGSSVFPLYLYANGDLPEDELFVQEEGQRPNFSDKFVHETEKLLKLRFLADRAGDRRKTFGPEDILHYAYAVFHAPSYRQCFAEFLRVDFPRLPLTSDQNLFRELCGAGKDLVALHLLRQTGTLRVNFPNKGSNEIAEVNYTLSRGSTPARVHINEEQWFENVPPEVWEYHVGGYQVCEKWLKDRKGRQLTIEERQIYPKIVAALHETIRIQREIDEAIAAAGGWPLK
jgi:predicted helicase